MTRSVTVLRGVCALALLVGIVVGLPVALLAVGGSPIPSSIPDLGQVWSTLTSRDDGTLFLGLLRVAAWAGWALFTVSVLADLVSRARNARVPRLGPQQAFASQLVAAVAALSVLAPAAATAAAAGPPPPAAPVTSSTSSTSTVVAADAWAGASARLAAGERSADSAADSPVESAVEAAWREVVVVRGDTLWELAERELGDPWRWPELFAASTRIVQPDGRRMADPDLILPGWTVRVPSVVAAEPARASGAADERTAEAAAPAQTPDTPVLTPLDTGGALTGAASAGGAGFSTPLSSRAPAGDEVAAEDWRAMIQRAVPELGAAP